jgi:hypothetical protein
MHPASVSLSAAVSTPRTSMPSVLAGVMRPIPAFAYYEYFFAIARD